MNAGFIGVRPDIWNTSVLSTGGKLNQTKGQMTWFKLITLLKDCLTIFIVREHTCVSGLFRPHCTDIYPPFDFDPLIIYYTYYYFSYIIALMFYLFPEQLGSLTVLSYFSWWQQQKKTAISLFYLHSNSHDVLAASLRLLTCDCFSVRGQGLSQGLRSQLCKRPSETCWYCVAFSS